jgi:hypothetical protein
MGTLCRNGLEGKFYHKLAQPARERMRGSTTVCVNGSLDGYTPGAVGAPNTAEFFTRLDYLGMRTVTVQDKARMQLHDKAQPAGRCPLCGDAKHSYKQGAYDHPAEWEITLRCPQVLSDGKACGLVHAFAGPLGTLCRGGWEGRRYRAPQ